MARKTVVREVTRAEKGSEERVSEVVAFRLTSVYLDQLDQAAEDDGLSRGEWVRELVQRKLRRMGARLTRDA